MRYAVSEKGEDELRASLESGRTQHWGLGRFATFESAPRAILLAWIHSGIEDALRCVGWAMEELRAQRRQKEREAEDLHDSMLRLQGNLTKGEFTSDNGILIATAYRWMKTASDAALLKMQAEVMGTMAPLLSDLPPALQMPQGNRED